MNDRLKTPLPRRWPLQLAAMALVAAAGNAAPAADNPPATPAPRRHDMASAKDPGAASAARHGGGKAFAAEQLIALLKVSLGDWKRESLETPMQRRAAGRVSRLSAKYKRADTIASVGVNDAGRPSTVVAQWTGGSVERDVEGGHEKTYKADGRVVRELFRETAHESSVVFTLANGVSVTAISQTADTAALKALIESMDLAAAEALKR